MLARSVGLLAVIMLFAAAPACGTSVSGGDCDCKNGAYSPVCGVDGKTYDAACGTECVPVAAACNGECPCAGGSSSGTSSGSGGGCDCMLGAYFPVCGVDGTSYDATCGMQCVPVAVACNGECPCAGTSTACGSLTCSSLQVCVTPGCGGAQLPDGGTCSVPPSCEPLPSGCGATPTCECLEPAWTTIGCGSLHYGALECLRPCA